MIIFAATIGLPEVLIVIGILVLLFGAKRLPEFGRGLGGGMREFKDSIKGSGRKEEREGLPAGDEAEDAPVVDGEVVRERR